MNFNETEKLNLSVKSKPETTTDNNLSANISPLPVEEKVKTEKETISIKNPEPLNIRELFKEKSGKEKQIKVDYREKQINESTVKNIKEAEIKISKSTEEVLNLIKQSKADLPKISNKGSQPQTKTEPIVVKSKGPDPELNRIIQQEISKLKEEVNKPTDEKPRSEPKPEVIKFSQPKRTPEPTKSEKVKINIPANTAPENKIREEKKDAPTDARIITKANETKPQTVNSVEDKQRTNLVDTGRSPLQKNPTPQVVKKEDANTKSKADRIPQVLVEEEQKAKTEAVKKGLVELSSLTPEEKRAFFKAQKEKSDKNKNVLKIAAASVIVVITAAVMVTFVFSGPEKEINQKIISQTKSTAVTVAENQVDQTKTTEQPQQKVETKSNNPTPNTENLSLPPLPEIQNLNEPIVNLIKEETTPQELINNKGVEEKTKITPPKENKIEEEEPPYFVAVEQMPEPIGGLAEIQKRVVYPNIALQTGIEGKVFVKAIVNEAGIVTQTEILKGIGAGCDEAAADAVAKTKFKPGIQRGKPVKVQMTIPIVFKKGQ